MGLVNHLLTLLLPPRVLPKLELKEGIPEEFTTFVVMPSMLVRPRSATVLCERLETHYLANPGANLRFALLTDFADAPKEEMPEDRALLDDALARVAALNERYAASGPGVSLPLPPPSVMEPNRELLDGLGAEARQAFRI